MPHARLSLAAILILLAFVFCAEAIELSADMITREGDQKQTGKLYVKGNKYRIDSKNGSEYAIIRHDKNKSWIVLPEQKAYIEMSFDPKKKPDRGEAIARRQPEAPGLGNDKRTRDKEI